MDVFGLRDRLVSDYRDYIRSFIKIRDPRIRAFVDDALDAEGFWPEPLLQLNPTFRPGGTIDDLVADGGSTRSARASSGSASRMRTIAAGRFSCTGTSAKQSSRRPAAGPAC